MVKDMTTDFQTQTPQMNDSYTLLTMEHLQTEDALSPAACAALRDYLAGVADDDGALQSYSSEEITQAYVELRKQYRSGGSPDLDAAAAKALNVLTRRTGGV